MFTEGRLKRREDSGSSTNTTASADNEVTKLLSVHEKGNSICHGASAKQHTRTGKFTSVEMI